MQNSNLNAEQSATNVLSSNLWGSRTLKTFSDSLNTNKVFSKGEAVKNGTYHFIYDGWYFKNRKRLRYYLNDKNVQEATAETIDRLIESGEVSVLVIHKGSN